MAAENPLVIQFNVGQAVVSRLREFENARSQIQGKQEQDYQNKANSEGWSYEERIAFRQAMLDKEKAKAFPDTNYIRDFLQKDISDLTKLNRTFQLGQRIQKDLGQVLSGHETWNDHLTLLQNEFESATDPDLKKTLQDEITTAQQQIFDNEKNIIDSQIQLAENGHNVDTLKDMIEKVKVEKAKFSATNPAYAAALDTKIQTLRNDITNEQIGIFKTQLQIIRARKGSALNYLNQLNKHVDESNNNQPIVYQGVQYKSLQDFWDIERDKYIDSTFMNDLTQEYNNYVGRVAAANGIIPTAALDSIQNEFKALEARPEMQEFINRLEIARTGIMADAIDKSAKAILGNYSVTNDARHVLDQLQQLQDKYGINTAQYSQKVVQDYAKTRIEQTGQILEQIMSYVKEGKTYQEAYNSVQNDIAAGKFVTRNISPEEAATKTPMELAKEAPQKTQEQLQKTLPTVPQATGQEPNLPTTPGQAARLVSKTDTTKNEGIFNPAEYISSRPSPANPQVKELYNLKTGQGFANPKEVYDYFIGKRPSVVNPSVNEYYNKINNQGFKNESELFRFANNLGAGEVSSFNDLGI